MASSEQAREQDSVGFALRFAGREGFLRASGRIDVPYGEIRELEVALSALRFPLDVSLGARGFRTRRLRVGRLVARVRVQQLVGQLGRSRGVEVELSRAGKDAEGAWVDVAARLGRSTVALRLHVAVDGVDLILVPSCVRGPGERAASPWSVLADAADRLGVTFDSTRGGFRVRRPLRGILAAALAPRGFRVPDERACGISLRVARDAIDFEAQDGRCSASIAASTGISPALDDRARGLSRHVHALLSGEAASGVSDAGGETKSCPWAGHLAQLACGARQLLLGEDASVEGHEVDVVRAHARLAAAVRRGDAVGLKAALRSVLAMEGSRLTLVEALRIAARVAGGTEGVELLSRAVEWEARNEELLIEWIAAADEAQDRQVLERALGHVRGLPEDPARARVAVTLARALSRHGLAAEAARAWAWVSLASPGDPELLEASARALGGAEASTRVVDLLDRAARGFRARGDRARSAGAHAEAGRRLLEERRVLAAIHRFELALEADPQSLGAVRSLGAALAAAGDPSRALAAYRRLLELEGHWGETDELAEALREGGEVAAKVGGDAAQAPFLSRLRALAGDDLHN